MEEPKDEPDDLRAQQVDSDQSTATGVDCEVEHRTGARGTELGGEARSHDKSGSNCEEEEPADDPEDCRDGASARLLECAQRDAGLDTRCPPGGHQPADHRRDDADDNDRHRGPRSDSEPRPVNGGRHFRIERRYRPKTQEGRGEGTEDRTTETHDDQDK